MDVYVYGKGKDTKKFVSLIKNLSCIATKEQLLNNGFTNYNISRLCYHKNISGKDNYPVTFSITLSSKTSV